MGSRYGHAGTASDRCDPRSSPGATSFVGGRLPAQLAQDDRNVCRMVRDRTRPAADVLSGAHGARSESYRTLRQLVQCLPAMIAPDQLENETQPVAIDDTVRHLAQASSVSASAAREIQTGCPDEPIGCDERYGGRSQRIWAARAPQ